MNNLIILVLFSVLTLSCNNSKNKEYSALKKPTKTKKHPGKKLMEISGVASNWAITFLETAERSKSTIATGKSRATPSLNSVLKNNMETRVIQLKK